MQKLEAIRSDKIWGYELWIASTHPNGCQEDFKKAIGGDYPLLIKVIQANDVLSIQVHPDDDWAVKLEGPGNRGKTECWYVLDAAPDAKVVYGIKEGYSNEVLAKAITENKLEDYLDLVPVKKGDFIFIPAGTVHAIGGGLRLLETQQSCDLTYRLYDWGRGREVHIEKGLAVIKREEMIPIAPFPGKFECKYFDLEEISVNGAWSVKGKSGSKPEDTSLLFVISAENARIKSISGATASGETKIAAEEIYTLDPNEEITISGSARIMKIVAK